MGRPTIKTEEELGYMREAGLVVVAIHQALRDACQPGVSAKEMDQVVYETIKKHEAVPNFLHYQGFPASVCLSINSTVVHGIPDSTVLQAGDIVSFDCGAKIRRAGKNWHSDAAITLIVGGPTDSATGVKREELNKITEMSMWAGIAALAGAKRVGEVGAAIEDYIEAAELDYGWSPGLIEGYSGHGIGTHLHEDPPVYNYRTRGRSPKVKPGMVLCIEPMLVAGDIRSRVLEDDWTVVTVDGSDASHWEHTVAVTEAGISVLTSPDFGKRGLEPFGVVPVEVPV